MYSDLRPGSVCFRGHLNTLMFSRLFRKRYRSDACRNCRIPVSFYPQKRPVNRAVSLQLKEKGLTVKATWKKQKDGTYVLKKVRSVKFKTKINGKNKTFTLVKDRDYKDLIVPEPTAKKVALTGMGNFSETVTVKTKK